MMCCVCALSFTMIVLSFYVQCILSCHLLLKHVLIKGSKRPLKLGENSYC